MSIKNSLSPLRPVKQARSLAMLTTSVAVSGGLVAGLGISQSAGAAPETGAVHDAAAAATTPLELKSVTPAKKLVVTPKAAPKAAPAKPAAAQAPKRHTAATHVSRSQARAALTTPVVKAAKPAVKKAPAKPATTKQAVRKAPATHRSATSLPQATPHRTVKHATHHAATSLPQATTHRTVKHATHHARPHHAAAKPATQKAAPQRHTTVKRHTATTHVDRTQARQAVTRHVAARPAQTASQPQQRQQARPAQVSRAQVRQAVTARLATPTYASHAQSTTTKAVSTPAKVSTSGVVSMAAGLTGIPYVYGGYSTSGIDCSGFVAMAYAKVGIQLPHQSEAIKAMTRSVSTPQPGDLAFLPGHVAIYAGNGMVYEARHPGTVTGLYPVLPGMTFGRL